MKKNNFLLLASAFSFFISCQKEDFKDPLTADAQTGGLVKVETPLISYAIGKGNTFQYDGSFTIDQGKVRAASIDVYKTFTDTKGTVSPSDDVVSKEVLLKNVSLSSTSIHETVNFKVTYDELRQGVTVNGAPMSNDDTTLNVGDYWTLKYVANTTEGAQNVNLSTSKVAVGTMFSGKYKVNSAEYFRIGVPRPDVVSTSGYLTATVIIEAISSTLYKVNDWWGPFTGNELYFTITGTTITYPANRPDGSPQVGNSQPMITCQSAPAELTNVGCGTSNIVTIDPINDHHQLKMSFGYLNAPGQSREFYQVLEKL